MNTRSTFLPALAGLALLGVAPAQASDLSFLFLQPTQYNAPNDTHVFTYGGTITDNSLTDDIYLKAIDVSLTDVSGGLTITNNFPQLASGPNNPAVQVEHNGAPVPGKVAFGPDSPGDPTSYFFIGAGQTVTIPDLFTVTESTTSLAGVNPGTFNFEGAEDVPGGTPNNDMRVDTNPLLTDTPGLPQDPITGGPVGNRADAPYTVILGTPPPPTVPEASSLSLLGLGLLGLGFIAARRRRA